MKATRQIRPQRRPLRARTTVTGFAIGTLRSVPCNIRLKVVNCCNYSREEEAQLLAHRHGHVGPASVADLSARATRPDVVIVRQVDIEHQLSLHRLKRARLDGEVVLCNEGSISHKGVDSRAGGRVWSDTAVRGEARWWCPNRARRPFWNPPNTCPPVGAKVKYQGSNKRDARQHPTKPSGICC